MEAPNRENDLQHRATPVEDATKGPETEYVAICKEANVRPSKYVRTMMSSKANSLVVLQLGDAYLGDKGAACFGRCLNSFPSLQALGLSSNGVCNEGVEQICRSMDLRAHPITPLAVLHLAGNHGITPTGGQKLLNTAGRGISLCVLSCD